jgi:glutaredoxin
MKVELLGRAGCGLCEEAAELLRRFDISFTQLDVDSSPRLAAYSDFIPVVMVDDRELARAPIEPARLRAAFARLERTGAK